MSSPVVPDMVWKGTSINKYSSQLIDLSIGVHVGLWGGRTVRSQTPFRWSLQSAGAGVGCTKHQSRVQVATRNRRVRLRMLTEKCSQVQGRKVKCSKTQSSAVQHNSRKKRDFLV